MFLLICPRPDAALAPAKQHLINGVKIPCDDATLLLEFLLLPSAAEHEPPVPPFVRWPFGLLVNVKPALLLVSHQNRLPSFADPHQGHQERRVRQYIR